MTFCGQCIRLTSIALGVGQYKIVDEIGGIKRMRHEVINICFSYRVITVETSIGDFSKSSLNNMKRLS